MTIAHNIPEPDRKGLREFGISTGAAIVIIFGLFFPWVLGVAWPRWPWICAGALWLAAWIYPPWLRLVYKSWMRFGLLASRIMTPLVLGIVFFVMISPMALLRRLMGKDPLHRELDPEQKSYRVKSSKNPTNRLERPF